MIPPSHVQIPVQLQEHVHFIGIGGIGMSALARILLQQGHCISGSDLKETSLTDALRKEGVVITIGHKTDVVLPEMDVVYTTGISETNCEYQDALMHGCRLWHRSDILAYLVNHDQSICIAGTHGKTTTSSLLTWILHHQGYAPSFAIGGLIPHLDQNGVWNPDSYFIVEACESDGTFYKYHPMGAIVTNIDDDHLSFYGSKEAMDASFKQFVDHVKKEKYLFWCADDLRLRALQLKGTSYGFADDASLRILSFTQNRLETVFTIEYKGQCYERVHLPLGGAHNVSNAAAVFGILLELGLSPERIREGMKTFPGVHRRCEFIGEYEGVKIYDDYGHHPTEIKSTLRSLRKAFPDSRIISLYQPHRYSRAKECLGLYQGTFDSADELIVTSIYSAGEKPIDGIDDSVVYRDIAHNLKIPHHFVERKHIQALLQKILNPNDVLITQGAGDIHQIGQEIMNQKFTHSGARN